MGYKPNQIMKIFARLIRKITWRTGRFQGLYRRICKPDGLEWGKFQKKWGRFHSIGNDVNIVNGCVVTDPEYTKIGNNVTLSCCVLLGHDGSIDVLNRVTGKKLDSVGKIEIKDNCFVGHGAIVMPRVTIGPNSIVAAGAVVTRDVPPDTIVGGNPAKFICTVQELAERVERRCDEYPWIDLIRQREGAFDPAMEPELVRQRVNYFFGDVGPK